MPERVVSTLPGGGGAKFLVRRSPFSERLGQGIAAASNNIFNLLLSQQLQKQAQEQRQTERGQEALTRLLPQLQTLIGEQGLSPEAGRALIESVASVHGVDAPELDVSLFKAPEPSPREQLQQFVPGAMSGNLTPDMLEAAASFAGIPTSIPTGVPPQSTGGAGAALTPLPGLPPPGEFAALPPHPAVPECVTTPELGSLQQLAAAARATRPAAEPEGFTLSPGEVRFRGGEEIARGLPKPEEEEEQFRIVGGTMFTREELERAQAEGRRPRPFFEQPRAGPDPTRVLFSEKVQDPQSATGWSELVRFADGSREVVKDVAPPSSAQPDLLEQLLQGAGGAVTPQPSHAPEEPGVLDRALSSISSFFGGGGEEAPPSSAAPENAAAENLLRSEGLRITPKNLALAKEELRRRSGGAQGSASPQVGSIVTHQGRRMRVVAIRPDGNLELEPAAAPDAGKVVTEAELQAIAARRGTTVQQERQRATAAGFIVR